ncbi:protein of unknown function [Xenorhabdus doucetiae]|uniref:Uncharacterized protein n=1 Tax=Xenorhabdus doucetiae TaxID=351671 RepID=A0A068QXH8_9GAMM|nr:protein of unknown function [Xenorhabdus doucetiae]
MSQLMTNWICIAMEGDTVDGRDMEPQWILDAAELYDPQLYTALIWPEHERWMGPMGEVLAVKAERGEDGALRLYAQLRPNHRLLDANRDGQLLFTSVEFTPDGNWARHRQNLSARAGSDKFASECRHNPPTV